MELFKNKVGRPSKETLRKRSIIKVVLTAVICTVIGCLGYTAYTLLNVPHKELANEVEAYEEGYMEEDWDDELEDWWTPKSYLEELPEGSAFHCKNLKPKNYKKVETVKVKYYAKGFKGQALQGATSLENGQIYYATTIAGSKIRSDYNTKIRMLGKNNEKAIANLKTVISPTRKIGDMTTIGNRVYYLAYSPSGESSQVYYYDGKAKSIDTGQKYIGIAGMTGDDAINFDFDGPYNEDCWEKYCKYNDVLFLLKSGKKKNELVVYDFEEFKKNPTGAGSRLITLYKNPAHTTSKYNVSTEAVAVVRGSISVAYNIYAKDNPNIIRNYVAVYNLKDLCGLSSYPSITYKVGTCDLRKSKNNCAVSSIFTSSNTYSGIMFGFNNNKFNTSYFYELPYQEH